MHMDTDKLYYGNSRIEEGFNTSITAYWVIRVLTSSNLWGGTWRKQANIYVS